MNNQKQPSFKIMNNQKQPSFKKPRKKLIRAVELVDRINRQRCLTKQEKFEKVIDIAFQRIYGVKEENWKVKYEKCDLLTEKVEKETKESAFCRLREAVNSYL